MKPYAILLLLVGIGARLFAAEIPSIVDWSDAGKVSMSERTQFWSQATAAINAAGYVIASNVTIKAEYKAERDIEPFEEIFFTVRDGKTQVLWVRCLYPIRSWLKIYEDLIAEERAEKYDTTIFRKMVLDAQNKDPTVSRQEIANRLKKHSRADAEERARALAKAVGNVDLAKWKCFCWQYNRGQWMFTFEPFFEEHRLQVGLVDVCLSDSDNLKLCLFHNTLLAPLPEFDRVPDVISQTKARELADKYLEQYYYHGKPPSLTFRTNSLEVVRPNYYFTKKYDESGQWLKNPGKWAWMAEYERKIGPNSFGFPKTPVWVNVDAVTGDLLGGGE